MSVKKPAAAPAVTWHVAQGEIRLRITWGIGNYTDDIEPSTATIYVDDAVIATERIGPR